MLRACQLLWVRLRLRRCAALDGCGRVWAVAAAAAAAAAALRCPRRVRVRDGSASALRAGGRRRRVAAAALRAGTGVTLRMTLLASPGAD